MIPFYHHEIRNYVQLLNNKTRSGAKTFFHLLWAFALCQNWTPSSFWELQFIFASKESQYFLSPFIFYAIVKFQHSRILKRKKLDKENKNKNEIFDDPILTFFRVRWKRKFDKLYERAIIENLFQFCFHIKHSFD
jgi:hypothetical protein